MSEKQKPDGWVAWHPKESIKCREICESETYALASLAGYVCPDRVSRRRLNKDPDVKELLREGWRIRPVKIVFLDEVKDG